MLVRSLPDALYVTLNAHGWLLRGANIVLRIYATSVTLYVCKYATDCYVYTTVRCLQYMYFKLHLTNNSNCVYYSIDLSVK